MEANVSPMSSTSGFGSYCRELNHYLEKKTGILRASAQRIC